MTFQGQVSWGNRFGIIVNNMLPAAGTLLLGWDAVPILILLWLDSWMGVWEIAAVACAQVSREQPPVFPPQIQGLRRNLYWGFTYLLVVLFASIPSLVALGGLLAVMEGATSLTTIMETLGERSLLLAVAVNVILRLVQSFVIPKPAERKGMVFTLEEKYLLVAFKALAMFMLASYVGGWGRTSLTVYIFVVCGFFAWTELDPMRVLYLLRGRQAKKSVIP